MDKFIEPNFEAKINSHFIDNITVLDAVKTKAINEIIKFIIVGFREKNNFNVNDFNLKSLIDVKHFYSKFKTNILINKQFDSYDDFFDGIQPREIKCMNFIFMNYKHKFQHSNEMLITLSEIINLFNNKR